jgi:hypothetical protein
MMNADQPPFEFESVAKLDAHLRANRPLTACVFQGLDLRLHTAALTAGRLTGSAFLGCLLEPGAVAHALADKALVVPKPEGIPFDPFRGSLYSVEQDLYAGYVTGQPGGYAATRDARIYAHFCATGRSHPPTRTSTPPSGAKLAPENPACCNRYFCNIFVKVMELD